MNFQKFISSVPRWLTIILVAFFLIFPILAIIPMSFNSGESLAFPPDGFSFRWYQEFASSPDWTGSLWVSIQVALMTVVFCLGIGIPASFALASEKLPFRNFWTSFFALPIIFPVVVSAVALSYYFAQLEKTFDQITLTGTMISIAISHACLGLPVVILPTVAALKRFRWELVWQARSLGAGPAQAFLTVTLPLLKTPFITAALFAFVTSFDEVVLADFLGRGENMTLPKKIWEGMRFDQEPTLAVVTSVLVILTMAGLSAHVFLQFLNDRKRTENLSVT